MVRETKLKLNKDLSVFNDFVVINVFEKGTKKLITIKSAYKPKDAEQWKSTDFIVEKKIDTIIDSLNILKNKLEEISN